MPVNLLDMAWRRPYSLPPGAQDPSNTLPPAPSAGKEPPMIENKTDLIRQYLAKVRAANKETTKREAFEDLLNRLYGADREILDVIDRMSLGAETAVVNNPRKDGLHRGSADALYNRIIIEFAKDLKVSLRHAKEQLAGYLLGQFKSGDGYH